MAASKMTARGTISWAFAAALAATVMGGPLPALAQSGIGSAAVIKNDVHGVRGTVTRSLAAGGAVYSEDSVNTGDASLAQLLFLDQTTFSIAADSSAILKNVYHPKQGPTQLVLTALSGAFRYVSGVQGGVGTRINFPFGYLTVRGTIVDILVWLDHVVIMLEEGAVTVVPYATHVSYDLDTPGKYLVVYRDGHVDGPITADSTIMRIAGGNTPFPLFGRTIWPAQDRFDQFDTRKDLNDLIAQGSNSSGTTQIVGVACPAPGVLLTFNGVTTCSQ
jgi:hypothetical protein